MIESNNGQTGPSLTVVICACNPRPEHLKRTLHALRGQTLPQENWKLLLVDNNSSTPLQNTLDLSWHREARIVVEPMPGVAAARSRAMSELTSELMVFVDEDNVLAADYLEQALRIANAFPQMGAFCGQLHGEFESEPPAALRPYTGLLALREFDRDRWSNFPLEAGHTPVTAGMCLRRAVAAAHLKTLSNRPPGVTVGSTGKNLLRGEDDDICYSAQTLNLGVGMFKDLHLTHLIPAERLQEDYLCRLCEGMTYSGYVLAYLWKKPIRPPVHSLRWRFGYWRMRQKMTTVERRFAEARVRAEQRAWDTIHDLERKSNNGFKA